MSSDFDPSEFVTIPEAWTCKRLIDCTIDGNLSYGIVQPGQHVSNGIPVIRINNINNGQLDLQDVLKVDPEIEKKYQRTRLEGGEVLLTLVGSTGQSFVAPPELKGWNVPRAIAVIRADQEIGSDWINICLQSKETKHFLDVRANTTVQKTLNLKDVRDIPILVPPKEIKELIEGIATSIAKKIELNRQTNQTLEQIAQALFKSWFVDFEPTRAKIAAKEAGASPEEIERAAMCAISGKTPDQLAQLPPETQQNLKTTAALFPDALVNSELGEVPEGWKVGTLANLCRLNESSWSEKNAPEEVNYVDLANTKNGIIEEVQRYSWSDAPSRARRILKAGDTIIGTVRPGNRSFSLIGTNEQVLTASTGFAVLSPKKKEYVELLYIASTSNESIDRLAHLADGGAYPAVRPDVVTQLEMVIPCDDLIEVFSELNRTVFTQMLDNLDENLTLKNLRDSLLPKLLSGEITLN